MKKEIAWAFFFTIIIFLLNYFLRTMLLYSLTEWESVYQIHQSEIPFRLRPFTNLTLYYLVNFFSLSISKAFIIHQYLLLFLFFVSLVFYFKILSFSQAQRILGLTITAFSFPILCLHFIPNYTWDNLWMYIGLIWFGYFIIKQNYYVASLFLLFSAFSHESALFVTIGFYFFRNKSKSQLNWILPSLIPVVGYLIFRTIVYPDVMTERFSHIIGNFENTDATRQTIFSIIVSFGWMWAVMVWGVWKRNKLNQLVKSFLFSSLFASIVTILIVLFVGKARETRLLYTPFLFLIPLVLFLLNDFFDSLWRVYLRIGKIRFCMLSLMILIISILLTISIFPSFSYLPMIDFHRVYFALNLFVVLLALLSMGIIKRLEKKHILT